MVGKQRASLPRLLVFLFLMTAPLAAQTLIREVTGESTGDRCASIVTTGSKRYYGGFIPHCGFADYRVTAAPGWSGATGRIEFRSASDPTSIEDTVTGNAPGEEFGHSLVAGANLGNGTVSHAIGAPGANADRGYVHAYDYNPCSIPAPVSYALWTVQGSDPGERFGHAMTVLEDLDGDGHQEVLVSAPRRDRTLLFGGLRPEAGVVVILSGATGVQLRYHGGTTSYGHFGWSLANLGDLNGDGVSEYAIGEPGYDAPDPAGGTWSAAGRVRVYSGATGTVLSDRSSSGSKAGANHGWSVASAGDANLDGTPDYVVGAPYYDLGSGPFVIFDIGHAEVRSGSDGSLILEMNGPAGSSRFGWAVAGGRDLTRDGHPEVVIGAPGYDSDRGRAQVWSTRTHQLVYDVTGSLGDEMGHFVAVEDDGWIVAMPGRFSDRGAWREYDDQVDWRIAGVFPMHGASLALLDDMDGDGWDDFAMGQYDPTGSYVAPIWTIHSGKTSAVLHSFSSSALRGHTVGGIGDVDGDGRRDLAHGKPHEGIVEIRSGASPATILRTHTEVSGALFGHAMADAGDVDGDGVSDYLVTAPLWEYFLGNPPPPDTGRIYVFSGASGNLIRAHSGGGAWDQLGYTVAGLGDVNGDGRADYGAGAPLADASPTLPDSGRAYVWSGLDGTVIWSSAGTEAGQQLGRGLCGPGDLDGDGLAEFAVGEPGWGPTPGSDEGRVKVHRGGPAGSAFSTLYTLRGPWPDGTVNSEAGWALTAIGDVDRDGVSDLAYSYPRSAFPAGGGVLVVSGSSGRWIWHRNANGHWTHGGAYGTVLAGRPAPHADGRKELLVGVTSTTESGGVDVIFHPAARSQDLGPGCGTGSPNPPSLFLEPPTLGRLMILSTGDFPLTASPVFVMMSQPTLATIPLGWGCTLYLDLASLFELMVLPPNYQVEFLIPDDPVLAGVSFNLQAFSFDSTAPLGIVLSSGRAVGLGF